MSSSGSKHEGGNKRNNEKWPTFSNRLNSGEKQNWVETREDQSRPDATRRQEREESETGHDERRDENRRDERSLNSGGDEKDGGNANLLFYQGLIPAQPDNVYIDDILRDWYNDMERLELGHNYIQWLFPTPQGGLNKQAQPLQPHEAAAIRNDPTGMRRFVKSYQMMLHFYGMQLIDLDTGEVVRDSNWEEQFKNLNFSEHNFLRITRMLESLGEMGLERYKFPFLKFVLTEAIEKRQLSNVLESCHGHWIPKVKDATERKMLKEHAEHSVEARQRSDKAKGERLHTYQLRSLPTATATSSNITTTTNDNSNFRGRRQEKRMNDYQVTGDPTLDSRVTSRFLSTRRRRHEGQEEPSHSKATKVRPTGSQGPISAVMTPTSSGYPGLTIASGIVENSKYGKRSQNTELEKDTDLLEVQPDYVCEYKFPWSRSFCAVS